MKTKYFIMSIAANTLFTASCSDFLDLEPLDSQTEAIYFKTAAQFQEAANFLHTDCCYQFGCGWDGNSNNSYAINFDYGCDTSLAQSEEVSGTNVAPTSSPYWNYPYISLRYCNQLLEKAEEYTGDENIDGPVGQAYFFRAYNHFFLLRRFGGVPIANKLTTVESDDPIVQGPRNSRYEVVKQILDDLDQAIAKLASTTKASTNNDGHVTCAAARALKARVCLFEATWEKYVGTSTDGDGVKDGAGSVKPENYPSITDMLTEAKSQAKVIIDSGDYWLFDGVNTPGYENTSYFYLFNLEGADSNPAGLSKSDNNEAIWRSVFDATLRTINMNVTHTAPASMSRKLIDMYLCRDGLPVHLSDEFEGYKDLNAEFENRDYRLVSCLGQAFKNYWGYGMYSTGADYSKNLNDFFSYQDFLNSPDTYNGSTSYLCVPSLKGGSGYTVGGRKYCTELASVKTAGNEAMDYMHIRLAEIYLIYAEATCELGNGNISDEDLDYSLNKVRARGGVAPLNLALLNRANQIASQKGYGSLTYLGEIRRERACELYGEGFRLNDLCRWGIAEEELAGIPTCGMYVTVDADTTYLCKYTTISPIDKQPLFQKEAYTNKITKQRYEYSYSGLTPTEPDCIIVEQATNRKFALKNYLQPIPTDQIKLNPNLKQNPGW